MPTENFLGGGVVDIGFSCGEFWGAALWHGRLQFVDPPLTLRKKLDLCVLAPPLCFHIIVLKLAKLPEPAGLSLPQQAKPMPASLQIAFFLLVSLLASADAHMQPSRREICTCVPGSRPVESW